MTSFPARCWAIGSTVANKMVPLPLGEGRQTQVVQDVEMECSGRRKAGEIMFG